MLRNMCFLLMALVCAAGAGAEVWLRSGSLGAEDAITPEELDYLPSEPSLWVVSARTAIDLELRAGLEAAGARIVAYLPRRALAVWSRGEALARAAALDGVGFVAPLAPALRIDPALRDLAAHRSRVLELLVVPDVDPATVARELAASGLEVLGSARGGPFGTLSARLPAGRGELVAAAAAISGVFYVGPRPRFALHNDSSIWVGQSGLDAGETTPLSDAGLRGEGQVVGMLDTGLDIDSCYFVDPSGPPPTNTGEATASDPTRRKVIAYDFRYAQDDPSDPGDYDDRGHGTLVAGSLAGDDLAHPVARDPADGMAPAAKLVIQDGGYEADDCADLPALGCPVASLVPVFSQAWAQGVRIHNNSWGDQENTEPQNDYTSASMESDWFMWTNPDFLLLYSAGNQGPDDDSVGSPSVAKNVISVGATFPGSRADSIAGLSGRGWAADGRIKPTVTCPGVQIVSANSDGDITTGNCNTRIATGTSMSSPTCAGLAALARQYFMDGYYPTGRPRPADAFTPSAALVKAALINSARDMRNVPAPPSRAQGFGRVTLADSLYVPGGERDLFVVDARAAFPTGSSGSESYQVEVISDRQPLRVTLVWTDAPSNPLAQFNLVNDLDLTVSGPSGTFLGNVLVDGVSQQGGSPDRLNVEELVHVDAPAPGTYTLEVRAEAVPDGPQGFALVATADAFTPTALVVASHRVVSTSDGDLTPEPGETVRLALTLRNASDAPATQITARLATSAPDVVVSDGDASWDDLTPEAQGESLPDHYTLELAPELPCAGSIPLDVEMTSAGEVFSGRLELAVGAYVAIEAESFDTLPADALPSGWTLTGTRPAWARAGADETIEATATSPGPASPPAALYVGRSVQDPEITKTWVTRGHDLTAFQEEPMRLGFSYWGFDLEDQDRLRVELSNDGGVLWPWQLLSTPSGFDSASDAGNAWSELRVELGELSGFTPGPDVLLRFEATLDDIESEDAVYVDDVTLEALFCDGPGCTEASASASASTAGPVCPGVPVELDASLSTSGGPCAAGPAHSWWEAGELVGSGETLIVHPLVSTTWELLVSCAENPHCEDRDSVTVEVLPGSAPAIDPNSLRATKLAGAVRLAWGSAGPHRYNVHESADANELPLLFATSPLNPAPLDTLGFDAPLGTGSLTFYGVYGASDCDGRSLP